MTKTLSQTLRMLGAILLYGALLLAALPPFLAGYLAGCMVAFSRWLLRAVRSGYQAGKGS